MVQGLYSLQEIYDALPETLTKVTFDASMLDFLEDSDLEVLKEYERRRDANTLEEEIRMFEKAYQIKISRSEHEGKITYSAEADYAMANQREGGIDFKRSGMDLEIDQAMTGGVQIEWNPAQIEAMRNSIDGFKPVIINITPLPSVYPLLGLAPRKEDEQLAAL